MKHVKEWRYEARHYRPVQESGCLDLSSRDGRALHGIVNAVNFWML